MAANAEDAVHAALVNQLILHEICTFLPLDSLLMASRVSKFWNSQIRTYLRDHRKCTAFISSPSPCFQLQNLGQDLAQMAIVPFNSLSINLGPTAPMNSPISVFNCHHVPHGFNHFHGQTLFTKLRLQHLCIWVDQHTMPCPTASLIGQQLMEKSHELISLTLKGLSTWVVATLCEPDHLYFPQLRKLEIADLEYLRSVDCKGPFQKLLDGAPLLQKITHNDSYRILEILPENKYQLLTTFNFGYFNNEDQIELVRKFVKSGPRLEKLWGDFSEYSDVPARCHPLFHLLIQSCSVSLKKLVIFGMCALQKIREIPPLPKLTQLSIFFDDVPPFRFPVDFPADLQSIQFETTFPKLEVVDLHLYNAGILRGSPETVETEFSSFVPHSVNASKTVKHLCLDMEVCSRGLVQLMKNFPKLESLDIYPKRLTSPAFPYKDVFRFWPNLKTLVINRFEPLDHRVANCDAEFCGINQEEVELLWDMEEEQLGNLHIVPVRPCVSTMKDLESFFISFVCGEHEDLDGRWNHPRLRRFIFISCVTEILVLKRMPWLTFNVRIRGPQFP